MRRTSSAPLGIESRIAALAVIVAAHAGSRCSSPSVAAGAEPGATQNELEDLRRRVAELENSQRAAEPDKWNSY